jgi:cephalosporin-C deacetylase-like acetyl esterase
MYQGLTMKPSSWPLRILALTLATAAALPAPAQENSTPKPPDNSGRQALDDYLNHLAAQDTAARRATIARITTRAQAVERQQKVRNQLLALLGDLPQRIPLNPRITGSTQLEGFRVDKVLFDSQPNFPITALLYVPTPSAGREAKFPAIVMAPGHSPAGKAEDVAFASAFARAGFIVLSYDPIGQGERLQYPDPNRPGHTLAKAPTGEHGEAGLQPTLLGDALARYFLWDGIRAVDFLQSLPSVDPHRIGAFGCSGGGAMTALLAALDPRIAASGVACYTTSFDALLPSATGVQDSEQSTPNFIASGLDFPDWSELAAPRPYAIIATTEDMFPFAGAQSTFAEAQRFYALFPSAHPAPAIPRGDLRSGADADIVFITGPGHHGNLRPILPQILAFFTTHLHPDPQQTAVISTAAQRSGETPVLPFPPPPLSSLVQVTPTGQLATSYPNIATVFTLNEARAATIITPHPGTLAALQQAIRQVTHADAFPGSSRGGDLEMQEGGLAAIGTQGQLTVRYSFRDDRKHPVLLLLADEPSAVSKGIELHRNHDPNTEVAILNPRPSPSGTEETKAPILGPYYLTSLRAQLVGKTLLGLRVDDVIRAVDSLAARPGVDPTRITAEASDPHLGLVLLHAAVLDPRLQHITIAITLPSYRSLIANPLPIDAPQDILPGVLRHYDIPDLIRILGPRLTLTAPKSTLSPNDLAHPSPQ